MPYTQLTLRFLRKYFDGVLRWDFVPDEGVPERLENQEDYNLYFNNKKDDQRPASVKSPG